MLTKLPQERRGFLHGITDAELLAVAGRTDEALAKLREATASGATLFWRFDFAAATLNSLRERPEFKQLVGELDAMSETQRQQVLALPDQGELDYRDQ